MNQIYVLCAYESENNKSGDNQGSSGLMGERKVREASMKMERTEVKIRVGCEVILRGIQVTLLNHLFMRYFPLRLQLISFVFPFPLAKLSPVSLCQFMSPKVSLPFKSCYSMYSSHIPISNFVKVISITILFCRQYWMLL